MTPGNFTPKFAANGHAVSLLFDGHTDARASTRERTARLEAVRQVSPRIYPAFVVVEDGGEGAAGALNSGKVINIQELLRVIVRAMGEGQMSCSGFPKLNLILAGLGENHDQSVP